MASDGAFPVEDFINAITTQLDRVQDALRLKAVNRPLTYALKDLQMELKVFVDLDPQGNVRFRPAGPNESGASTVNFGFTTITKPMIEENTVSMAATRSAPLTETSACRATSSSAWSAWGCATSHSSTSCAPRPACRPSRA
ncbi:hypothetical protein LRS03_05305 [Rhizobacter sp. J219]|uniref:hypothetical protein n=1 Tax=Rhizobacter sp. J219 TaxID=2898430 RepID=UPI002151D85D|nr:hypothetical protein [Rhizobacter sp. J219]MCR5882307.1 hypothetical protein [Rhizobacter sp. J219]